MKKGTSKQNFAEHLLENMTWPERILWSRLRHRQTGYSFQRQAIVRGYVVDFWCAQTKVAIELDGHVHDSPERQEEDAKRDDFLSRGGVLVLRFSNSDVIKGMSAVLIRIFDNCYRRSPIDVKPFPLTMGRVRSRRFDSVEMRGLRSFQELKRLEKHTATFDEKYRAKKRANGVDNTLRGRYLAWREKNRGTGKQPKS